MPTDETRRRLHLEALEDIAYERFPFPNEEHPHLKTFLNQPQRSMGVEVADSLVYPDIVVLQWPERVVRMVAEVETAHTISVDKALQEWLPSSQAGPLYLFVPVGYAEETRRICRAHAIHYMGLRTWRYLVGYGSIEITDIETAPVHLEALLPGFLTRLLTRRRSRG